MSKRGENQSTSTKYATTLLCNALRFLESGAVWKAHELIQNAVSILPDVDDSIQGAAYDEKKKNTAGYFA